MDLNFGIVPNVANQDKECRCVVVHNGESVTH